MKPTVGRIVHYHPGPGGPGPYAAMITAAGPNDGLVLTVFPPDRPPVANGVVVYPENSPFRKGAEFWEWPRREG